MPLKKPASVLFHSWLGDRATVGRAGATAERYKSVIDSFREHLGEKRSGASIASLTGEDIEAWRNAEMKEGKGKTPADFGTKVLRAALDSASLKGLIWANPAESVESTGGAAEIREPFTSEELADLLRVANDEWRGMILLGA